MEQSTTGDPRRTRPAHFATIRLQPLAFTLLTIAVALHLPPASAAPDPPALLADFERSDALRAWRTASGPAPETSATLTTGAGHRGQGAVLQYHLPCNIGTGCDAFAEARWHPAAPLPKRHNPALSLWLRAPAGIDVSLLLTDTRSHTAHLPIRPRIEYAQPGEWRYAVVLLASDNLSGRVAEIAIRVQATPSGATDGAVGFDDIQIRDSNEVFQLDPGAPTVLAPWQSPGWSPNLGVNIHLLRDDTALDLARSAGFTFVRMDMLWANVERGGRYRFLAYDVLLRALETRGMGVLWILDYGHPEHGGSVPRSPDDIAAFARFAGAAAAHFRGHAVRYEIWNEPNTSQFWPPAPNPPAYAVLLREAVAAIRSADPAAPVSAGGLSRFDESFLAQAVGPALAASLTAIGVHPYPTAGPESIAPELQGLRAWIAHAFGGRIEIWDTEWGYSSANAPKEAPSNGHTESGRERQAVMAMREMLTIWAAGLPLAVWYDLRDDGTDPANPEHNYGLLDSQRGEKAAMKAIRTFTSAIPGRKFAGMLQEAPAGMHAMRFDGPGDTLWIVWGEQERGHRTVQYPRANLLSSVDLMGRPVKPKDRPPGPFELNLDAEDGPVYLTWATPRSRQR